MPHVPAPAAPPRRGVREMIIPDLRFATRSLLQFVTRSL
jgi:hypothetical protein